MITSAAFAERFFQKVLQAKHTATRRVITVDKNAAYPPAFETLQQEGQLPPSIAKGDVLAQNRVIAQLRGLAV